MEWDLTVQLINATVQIEHSVGGERRTATGFLVDAPRPDGTPRVVLVTAAHVVEPAEGGQVRLGWRDETGDGGWRFNPLPAPLTAVDGRPYWTRHPERDVAVLEVSAPPEFARAAIPLAWLGDDASMGEEGIGPGDELMALGFPRGLSANRAGFPILRSGRVASWPLWPVSAFPTFLIDVAMYPGNSGGPVFTLGGARGWTHPVILGLVTQQVELNSERLGIGVVTHAVFVRQTIALMDQGAPVLAAVG
ncbi:serine protease [Brevundimonas sp.]|uniref:trypsin-like serine peptidase n=1 Tax=Brevundimonas sp. TaxID=1871086 RepID=UPI0025EC46EC|nr:serine protease [Brevundimonas sp.]